LIKGKPAKSGAGAYKNFQPLDRQNDGIPKKVNFKVEKGKKKKEFQAGTCSAANRSFTRDMAIKIGLVR
jgi:hypothetical protein